MNPFHDQKCSVLFYTKTSYSSLSGVKGEGRGVAGGGGGREESWQTVICHVCMCVVKNNFVSSHERKNSFQGYHFSQKPQIVSEFVKSQRKFRKKETS